MRFALKQYDLICAGFACLDIIVSGNIGQNIFSVDTTAVDSISMSPGGDAVNEAITATTLGLKTALVAGKGNDWLGNVLAQDLKQWDIDLQYFEEVNDASITSVVLVGKNGQRNFLFNRGCGTTYVPSPGALDIVKHSRILSLASFFVQPCFDKEGAPKLLEEAKKNGVLTLADTCWPTLGQKLDCLEKVLPLIDYFLPSQEEAENLTGETDFEKIYQVFFRKGLKNLVIKLGAQGCFIRTPEKALLISTFIHAPVIDTTGCGDSFVGAFSYGLLHGYSLEECAIFANAAASIHAGYIGGSGSLESDTRVLDFVKKYRNSITIIRS